MKTKIKIFLTLILSFLLLNLSLSNGVFNNYLNSNNKNVNLYYNYNNIVLTRNVSYNITLVKQNFYHNNISISEIIDKYLKSFGKNIGLFLNVSKNKNQLFTTPFVSLLNGFLKVETNLDNFNGRITVNDFFGLTIKPIENFINKNAFNKKINLLYFIKKLEQGTYIEYKKERKNLFICNIGHAIKNDSNIIYLLNGKDLSKYYESKFDKTWTKKGHKISLCKTINQFLLNQNYRVNLYYLLNGKSSYVGAVLLPQFMPNNLYYYLTIYKGNKNVNLSDITFYYNLISLFLFGKDYLNEIKKFNEHFSNYKTLKNCIYSITYDPYCIYIKKKIFLYNRVNWYVRKVLGWTERFYLLDKLGIFVSPFKDYLSINGGKINIEKNIDLNLLIKNNEVKIKKVGSKLSANGYLSIIYNSLIIPKCYFISNGNTKKTKNLILCKIGNNGFIGFKNLDDIGVSLNLKQVKRIPYNFYKISKKIIKLNNETTYYYINNVAPGKVLGYINIINYLNKDFSYLFFNENGNRIGNIGFYGVLKDIFLRVRYFK